jgi:opacity protein-like surface antigen
MCNLKRFGLVFVCICAATVSPLRAADTSVTAGSGTDAGIGFYPPKLTIWVEGVGEEFRSSVQSLAVEAGAVQGIAILGSRQSHDLALLSVSYGHMLGHTVGLNHFYRGNWELRAEMFGGSQFAPTSDWVIGLAPHLRYNFATGTRLVPYVDGGAGVTATSIGPPDLSNTFEFNLQATVGTRWFVRDNLALTLEVRYLHMSCAGISNPNLGLNGVMGMIGLTYFF